MPGKSLPQQLSGLHRRTALGALVWTLLIALSLYFALLHNRERSLDLAGMQAKTLLERDLAFRLWATKHGGLYLPVTAETQPSPFMAHIPERDVLTPSGRTLTLYNPATLLRLIMETQSELYGVKARITGEKYLNPGNAPDKWESKALAIVGKSLEDYSEVTVLGGKEVIRRMQPMIMEEGCLKCHAWTGIPVGRMRGATDVAVPLEPYLTLQTTADREQTALHGGVWLLGLGVLGFMTLNRRQTLREEFAHEETLRKLNLAVEQSASGILITDMAGRIEYANPRLMEITGYAAEELLGASPRLFKSGETASSVYVSMWEALEAGREWRGEFKNRSKDGRVYWCMETISPVQNSDGATTHYIAVIEDISVRKNAEETIRRLAFYDPLTELPNRRLLAERLQQAKLRSDRDHVPFALLYLDLDRFKTVNDTLGHGVGDQLLKITATRFALCLRDSDTLARLGGDEFAILVEVIRHKEDTGILVHRLLECMRAPCEIEAHKIYVTPSIGVSLYPSDAKSVDELIRNADVAMYEAKARGKNTFAYYDPSLDQAVSANLTMETGLRAALDHDELFIEYQPKLDLVSGRIFGMEALVRWRHPQLGLVGPDQFIPLAEEIREIDRIGAWVLRTACAQAQRWRQAGHDLTLSVNVSPLQFQRSNLREMVDLTLASSGLAPTALELEITESALVAQPDHARAVLASIAELGVGFSIDDFGTGYSSLSQLKLLKVSTLKIDRSFVRDLVQDENDRSIATAIIAMARSMNLKVIAEGVETEAQAALLSEMGCRLIQGYHVARPLAPEAFAALLDGWDGSGPARRQVGQPDAAADQDQGQRHGQGEPLA